MEAYKKAEELYEDGDYEEAMEAYAQVSEDDSNYEEAQSKMSQCIDSYKAEILNKTENPEDALNYFITENLSLYLLASHSLLHCSFYRLQCLR